MKQYFTTAIVVSAALVVASTPSHGRQDPRPDSSELPAVRLRVDTLSSFITHVAGLRVRVVNGVVDEIASARVFTVRNERSMRHVYPPAAVAIVVIGGEAVLREGAPVVVTGIARTLLGAELSREQPLPALTDDERETIAELPLVVAGSVETPDGTDLVRVER